ncbi:hypothetical protein [Burkholderia glumae]|nr:hypothetical protein [Burkholderia glumae]
MDLGLALAPHKGVRALAGLLNRGVALDALAILHVGLKQEGV